MRGNIAETLDFGSMLDLVKSCQICLNVHVGLIKWTPSDLSHQTHGHHEMHVEQELVL